MNALLAKTPGPFARRAFVLFLAVWGACLVPLWRAGALPGYWHGDTNTQFVAYRAFMMRAVAEGNFPDLSGGMFLGQPFCTYSQPLLAYLPHSIGYALPLSHTSFFLLSLWFHGALGAAGMAWWMRRRRVPAAACLAIGWAFLGSSAMCLRMQGHWTLLYQAALVPWVLGSWEALSAWRPAHGWRPWVPLALGAGLLLAAQNPQPVFVAAVLLAPLEGHRAWRRRRVAPLVPRAAAIACTLAAALALGAAAWLPMVAGVNQSARGDLTPAHLVLGWPLAPVNLLGLWSPTLLFGGTIERFRGAWWPQESAIIMARGAVVLAIAGAAGLLASRPLRARAALPLAMIAGGLALGLFPATGLGKQWAEHVPVYGSMRAWGRASLFIVLGILALAGEGARLLPRRGRVPRAALLAASMALLVLSGAVRALLARSTEDVLAFFARLGVKMEASEAGIAGTIEIWDAMAGALSRDTVFYGAWAAVGALLLWRRATARRAAILAAAALLLAAEADGMRRFMTGARAPVIAPATVPALVDTINKMRAPQDGAPLTVAFEPRELNNFALHLPGVRGTHGADPNMRRSYARWVNGTLGIDPHTYQLDMRVPVLSAEFIRATNVRARVTEDGEPDRPDAPNAYTVLELAVEPPPYAELLGDTRASVRNIRWTDGHASIDIDADGPGTLRVREFPDAAWRVRVNGVRTAWTTDGASIDVGVSAGASHVTLDYIDVPARAGAVLSLAAWLLFAAAAFSGWIRSRRGTAASRRAA